MKTTKDAFLGGRVVVEQPSQGYRAATDPVILAASVEGITEQTSVLDVGAGVGVASICLLARQKGFHLTALEVQPEYLELAVSNALANEMDIQTVLGDLFDLPQNLRDQAFDIVMTNPPFFGTGLGTGSDDPGKDLAFRSAYAISDWIKAAGKRVKPKGWIYSIQLTSSLGEVFTGLGTNFGDIQIRPIAPRDGRDAGRVLIRARKGSKAPMRLLSPLIMHHGRAHLADRKDYSERAIGILKDMNSLDWC